MHAKRLAEAPTDPVLTPRLVLTPVGPDDVNDLLLLYSDPSEQFHDLLDQEAALVAVGQAAEGVQRGVGDLEWDHPEDLRAGDGRRR